MPSTTSPARVGLLSTVVAQVPRHGCGRPVLVGVDGRDGAGKTVFADELAAALEASGRTCVRASVDDFHHPAAVRYARGRRSPEGFWLDSFDHDRLVEYLLDPLGPGGNRRYRRRSHDLASDAYVEDPWLTCPAGAVVVVDGLFLHRDELVRYWDLSVLLRVSVDVSMARLALRDGTPADPADPRNDRYVTAQRLYRQACDPAARATLVVDNDDLAAPRFVTPGR